MASCAGASRLPPTVGPRHRLPPSLLLGALVFCGSCFGDGGTGPGAAPHWAVVAAGFEHTCALTDEGKAYCWGTNRSGQLGDGTTTDRDRPTAVLGGLSFGAIAVGIEHTCALATSGGAYSAYCWGSGTGGQLGDGTTTDRTRPAAVSGGVEFRTITAGGYHTCALTPSGLAYCWGSNAFYQLGDGSATHSEQPTAVSGSLTFQSLSASEQHTCGVTTAGAAYCWGRNGSGQLGDGTTTNRATPTVVVGGVPFRSIGTGSNHTCALAATGAVFCWGANRYYGQLGDGSAVWVRYAPAEVAGALSFESLSVGRYGACGFTAAGVAYCWGVNNTAANDTTISARGTPTAITGGLAFATLSAGSAHTCGVTPEGSAYCWGSNYYGQLGSGMPTAAEFWPPQPVGGGLRFQSLTVSGGHTCGLTSAGFAYCWGANSSGELGDGTTTLRSLPTAVAGGLTFRALSSSPGFTCGLDVAGAAYCWGANGSGQIGDGSTTARSTPTAVTGGLALQSLSAGVGHVCGLAVGGVAYCWGANGRGQLGDGTTTDRLTPTVVGGGVAFQSISAGTAHTCGVTASGAAYCWGSNDYGVLGDSTATDRLSPVAVRGGLAFARIVAGGSVTCGVTSAGAGYCWGFYCCGQLGIGTGVFPSIIASPMRVAGTQTYRSIDTRGVMVVCGLTTSGAAYCWGSQGYSANLLGSGDIGGFAPEPSAVHGGIVFASLCVGGSYMCGLTASGVAYCWGGWSDADRMARTRPQVSSTTPVAVARP